MERQKTKEIKIRPEFLKNAQRARDEVEKWPEWKKVVIGEFAPASFGSKNNNKK
jgi:hypothetical protein